MQKILSHFFDKKELDNYLKKSQFEDKFTPYTTLPFLMHWSDHKKTTDALRSQISHNDFMANNYQKISEELEALKKFPLWLEFEGGVMQFSVYDLYHHLFVTNKFSHDVFYGVSFIGPYGPFVKKRLYECLNYPIYKSFVYLSLIQKKIPQRSFRLQCDQHIMFSRKVKGKQTFDSAIVRSISEEGLLVELSLPRGFEELQRSQNVGFHLSTNELKNSFSDAHRVIQHSKLLYSKDPKSSLTFDLEDLSMRTSLNQKNELAHFVFAKFEKARTEELWPDLLKLATTAKDEVEEALNLAA